MTTTTAQPLAEGFTAARRFEVAELSRSYPTEQAARDAANRARALFKTNVSVQQVLDSIAFAQTLALAA